ncbi:MAG: sortase [Firmicutes bacterium]|nr:sortase [Bacillota bacterium]
MIIGLLLLATALLLAGRNILNDSKAGNASDSMVEQMHEALSGSDLQYYDGSNSANLADLPDYIRFPDMELPVGTFDGQECIGILQLPTLDKEFAVIGDLTYDNLYYAPCRFYGTPYKNNMVIAAHNFYSHFTYIRNLELGDSVIFIDMAGNVFNYKVGDTEVLQPYEVEKMIDSQWDLSLFTCTFDSASRFTVRCVNDNTNASIVDLG